MKKFRTLVVVLGVVIFAVGIAWASVEIERVTVNGVCRAWKVYDYSGALKRIEIFYDNAVGNLYADSSVTGSIAWAASLIPTNGTIKLHPGTYMVDRTTTITGATLEGKGATIKRIAQISTTTDNTITAGATTSITVADATGFLVGQSIAVKMSDNTYTASNYTISSIVGNVITVSAAFTPSSSGGTSTVYLSFDTLTVTGTKIHDLEIDGNKSNWTWYKWENTSEIKATGSNNHIASCYIHDAPGECIQEKASVPWNYLPVSTNNIYKNNLIQNINGNGVHLSASLGALIEGNYIDNTNLDGANVGHNGGNIGFSSQVSGLRVIGNTLKNGRCGVAGIGAQVNNVLISGNTISGATTYAIDGRLTTVNTSWIDVNITGNTITDSATIEMSVSNAVTTPAAPTGTVTTGSSIITSVSSVANVQVGMTISGTGIPADSYIIGTNGTNTIIIGSESRNAVVATGDATGTTLTIAGQYPKRLAITNNALYNTSITLSRILGASVSGNTIVMKSTDTTSKCIYLSNILWDFSVTNNVTRYGDGGIVGSSGGLTNTVIANNALGEFTSYGVYTGGTSTNVLIASNVITNTLSTNASGRQGIYATTGTHVKGNTIKQATGYATIRVDASKNNVILQGNTTTNTAYNGSARFDIRIESGNTAYMVINNQCTNPVSDVAAVGIRVSNNDALAGPPGTGKMILDNVAGPTLNQVYGSVNLVNANITVTLPTAVAGMNTCVVDSGTAHDIIVDVQATDNVVLVGSVGAGGVGITNASGSSTGDFVCLEALAANKWYVLKQQGTWASQ